MYGGFGNSKFSGGGADRRPVFYDVLGQLLGPLLHVSLQKATLPALRCSILCKKPGGYVRQTREAGRRVIYSLAAGFSEPAAAVLPSHAQKSRAFRTPKHCQRSRSFYLYLSTPIARILSPAPPPLNSRHLCWGHCNSDRQTFRAEGYRYTCHIPAGFATLPACGR